MLQSAPQLVSNDVFLQFEAEHIGYDEFSELFHSCLLSLRAHSNLTQLLCTMPKHDFPSSPLPPPAGLHWHCPGPSWAWAWLHFLHRSQPCSCMSNRTTPRHASSSHSSSSQCCSHWSNKLKCGNQNVLGHRADCLVWVCPKKQRYESSESNSIYSLYR